MRNSLLLPCGTALLLATNATAITPGLFESRYDGQTRFAAPYGIPEPTRARITQSPIAANVWGDTNGDLNNNGNFGADWPPDCYSVEDGNMGWRRDATFRYSGYLFVGPGTNKVTFAVAFVARSNAAPQRRRREFFMGFPFLPGTLPSLSCRKV